MSRVYDLDRTSLALEDGVALACGGFSLSDKQPRCYFRLTAGVDVEGFKPLIQASVLYEMVNASLAGHHIDMRLH